MNECDVASPVFGVRVFGIPQMSALISVVVIVGAGVAAQAWMIDSAFSQVPRGETITPIGLSVQLILVSCVNLAVVAVLLLVYTELSHDHVLAWMIAVTMFGLSVMVQFFLVPGIYAWFASRYGIEVVWAS